MKPTLGRERLDEADPALHFGPRPAAAAEAFWNKNESLARLGGDEELLRELCEIFLEECAKLLRGLRQGIAVADPQAVMRSAHSLKGELGYLGAKVAAQASRALEDMGHEKNMTRVAEVFVLLERELEDVCFAIKGFMGVMR
jgi:two-component system, sensor histidine kinase and response regulator